MYNHNIKPVLLASVKYSYKDLYKAILKRIIISVKRLVKFFSTNRDTDKHPVTFI